MPLLTPKQKPKKSIIRIALNEDHLKEIEAYAKWSGFQKIDDFIEQAAEYVIAKDKDWKKRND